MNLFKGILIFAFFFVFIEYIALMKMQSNDFDIYATMQKMQQEKNINILHEFEVRYYKCRSSATTAEQCDLVGELEKYYRLSFPNPDETEKHLKTVKGINKVEIIYELNEQERKNILGVDNVILAIPSFVARNISINFGSQSYFVRSPKETLMSTISLPLDLSNLQNNSPIIITADIANLPFYGSANLPMVIAIPEAANEYISLERRMNFAKEIASRVEIGFPLLLVAIALVLDHSLSFGLLSMFSMALASRSFISYDVAHGGSLTLLKETIFIFANAGAAAFLTLFVLSLWNLLPKKQLFRVVIVAIYLAIAYGIVFIGSDGLLLLDLYLDCLSTAAGIIIVGIGIFLYVKERRRKDIQGEEDGNQELLTINPFIKWSKAGILCVGLAIHFSVNWSELVQTTALIAKNFLDWRHNVLSLSLITAALIEMGTVTKRIKIVAKTAVDREKIENEMKLGRSIQGRLLGKKKNVEPEWWSRALYVPAIHLAGDWYNIRKITYANGKTLIAIVVADVVGHGIGAALVTSVLCSQWNLWWDTALSREFIGEDAFRGTEICELFKRWHVAVYALGKEDTATAAMVLLDPDTGDFSYCTAGHPSILLQTGNEPSELKIKSLRVIADGIGAFSEKSSDELHWEVKSANLKAGDILCIYSDGLSANTGKNLRGFTKDVEYTQRETKDHLIKIVASKIKEVKRYYRINRSVEDDITVLFVGRT